MRRRVGIYGLTEEVLQLVRLLLDNPQVEIAALHAPETARLRERLSARDVALLTSLQPYVTDDASNLAADPTLHAVIDAGTQAEPFATRFPEAVAQGLQVASPLAARLLWGYATPSADHKAELLQTLQEIVESVALALDSDEVFERMLEIARRVTGAEGGSLMLLDDEGKELRVCVAVGLEPELWPKIRVPLGQGIAGKVARDGQALRLRGRADAQAFQIVHERLNVESALCAPLIHDNRTLGVLNLHHTTRPDAFSDRDLHFVEQLARLDAQIIARAQEHQQLRSHAERYAVRRDVRQILHAGGPLASRLAELCRLAATRMGDGVAQLYLAESDEAELHLAATSLSVSESPGDVRLQIGQGLDGRAAALREPVLLRGDGGSLGYAALPLLHGDALVGVLSLQAGPRAPSGGEIEDSLLELAAAAGEGIGHVRREQHMATRATRLNTIHEAGLKLLAVRRPDELERQATSAAALALDADHAVLRLLDDESGRFTVRSYYGAAEGAGQEALHELDAQISRDVRKRRSGVLVRETSDATARVSGIRSLVCAPLRRGDRLIGTLGLYDKVAPDHFSTGRFSDEDLELLNRFAGAVQRGLAESADAAEAADPASEAGVSSGHVALKRLDEEIERAAGRSFALVVATCKLDRPSAETLKRVAGVLRSQLRSFDVLGNTGEGEFLMVLPEPGPMGTERVLPLARAVSAELESDAGPVAVSFGYALYPEEAAERESLLARAREPRIRVV